MTRKNGALRFAMNSEVILSVKPQRSNVLQGRAQGQSSLRVSCHGGYGLNQHRAPHHRRHRTPQQPYDGHALDACIEQVRASGPLPAKPPSTEAIALAEANFIDKSLKS
jgi:hypothetical protein